MCAILDANVAHEVFGKNSTEPGRAFRNWLNKGHGRLVVGGKARKELERIAGAKHWLRQGILSGRVRSENDVKVASLSDELQDSCVSDDPHVIALAKVSGARLLYSNDQALQKDFRNGKLLDRPRGKVFTTSGARPFKNVHERLLNRKDLCGGKT